MLIAETKLFIGLDTGEIKMYDPFTLELLDKVNTNRHAMPMSMVLQSAGTIIVGMTNGTLEVFSFQQRTISPTNHIVNEIKVPYSGEIYSICISSNEDNDLEIGLSTFSGLFFGKFEIGPQGRPYQIWTTTKVYFREKLIS